MGTAIASVALAIVVVAALAAGPDLFGAVVTGLAVLFVLDLSGVLARARSRPVVVAAFVPGVGLPAAIAFGRFGWESVPGLFAAGFVAAFVLVLAFGRRTGVTAGVGGTLLVSLVVGLGSAGVLLLAGLPEGIRWVIGLLALVAAGDAGARVGPFLLHRRHPSRSPVGARLLGAMVAVAGVGGGVAAVLAPPFTPAAAALIAGVALVAALGVDDLGRGLACEAGLHRRHPPALLGRGLLVGPAGTALLSAPAAYVLARGVMV